MTSSRLLWRKLVKNGHFLANYRLINHQDEANLAQCRYYHLYFMELQRYAQICWKLTYRWREKWGKVAKRGKNGQNRPKMAFFAYFRSNFSKFRIFPDITPLPIDAAYRVVTKMGSLKTFCFLHIFRPTNIRIRRPKADFPVWTRFWFFESLELKF